MARQCDTLLSKDGLMGMQFAYATVNHNLNSYSNNEPPHSQKIIVSDRQRSSI